MAKNLVVVESPAKARTIGRILGSRYEVKASMGHVRDLPEDELGVDVDNSFTPEYIVLKDKRSVVTEIKKLAKEADALYLATDPDREGEAIAWHLVQAAGLKADRTQRVVFHEITPAAVREAFRSPRSLDMDLVSSQQARRVLDRLVGYKLSPLLWQKIRWRGLSAGRVQSAALRLVVDREREIEAFVPREYWIIEAELAKEQPAQNGKESFKAQLYSLAGRKEKLNVTNEAEAKRITSDLDGAAYRVADVKTKEVRARPAPPFITSTLQQEAWRKLSFPAKKTMLLAQQLYEGVPLGAEGSVGLITYMRTDSTQVAQSAVREARDYIRDRFGADYVPTKARAYARKVKGAQEAHEAIRPTSVRREPEAVKAYLTSEQRRLYDLIWKRFLASQMTDAVSDVTTADIHARPARRDSNTIYLFRATGSVLKFPGFRAVYMEGRDEEDEERDGKALPPLAADEPLRCLGLEAQQHFTEPPPRYSEASLIRALEEKGIGRPSTYAAIVSTIQDRGYVKRDGGRLRPQPLGIVVNDLLAQHFSEIVDLDFTANMEEELDDIARGQREWVTVVKGFYAPFARDLERAVKDIPRVYVPTSETCELCGRPMVLKQNRWGRSFLSCSGYPQCRGAKPYRVSTGVHCPRCGGDLVERHARKGRRHSTFYGCSNYPTCNFVTNRKPLPVPCPSCGGLLTLWGRNTARCTACDYKGPVPEEEREAVGAQSGQGTGARE